MKKSELVKLIKEEIKNLNEGADLNKLDSKAALVIIAQYEAIRRAGKFNMMDFYSVQREAFDQGYYELVNFTENDSKNYSNILKNYGKLISKVKEKDIPK